MTDGNHPKRPHSMRNRSFTAPLEVIGLTIAEASGHDPKDLGFERSFQLGKGALLLADAILEDLNAAGFQLVPKRVDGKMRSAAVAMCEYLAGGLTDEVWRAMLAAVPREYLGRRGAKAQVKLAAHEQQLVTLPNGRRIPRGIVEDFHDIAVYLHEANVDEFLLVVADMRRNILPRFMTGEPEIERLVNEHPDILAALTEAVVTGDPPAPRETIALKKAIP